MNAFTARSIAVRALLAAMLLTSMACTPLQVLTHSVSQNEARVPVGRYDLDLDHCSITFDVEHFKYSRFTMRFDRKKGQLNWNEGGLEQSSVSVSIDAASIDTNVPLLDKMVKSESLLDVERYPEIRFVSTKFERTGESRGTLTGNLTIHGVTRKATFSVEGPTAPGKDPWGNLRIGLSASTKINRKDFGLTWNAALETGGILVGDEVTITLDVEAVKA